MTPDLQTILERLEKLERQNRRLKLAGVVALIAVGVFVLKGLMAPTSRTLRAQEFQLVDSSGKLMGKLGLDGKSPELEFYNQKGLTTASLYAYGNGNIGGLLLSDVDSGESTSLLSTGVVGPELRFADKGGVKVALSLSRQTADASLDITDAKGNRSVAGSAAGGATDAKEAQTIPGASLVMLGQDNKVIWRAP